MANAFLNMAKSTKLLAIVRRSKSMGRIPTGATGARFLGETDADANAEMVAIVNDCVRRLLDEFPQLNVPPS